MISEEGKKNKDTAAPPSTGNGRTRTRQPHGHARAQPATQEGRPHLPFLHRSVGRSAPAYVLTDRVVPTSSVPSDRHAGLVNLTQARAASRRVLPRQRGKQSVQSLPAALAHQNPRERGGGIFPRRNGTRRRARDPIPPRLHPRAFPLPPWPPQVSPAQPTPANRAPHQAGSRSAYGASVPHGRA